MIGAFLSDGVTRRSLGFDEARIEIDPDGAFTARLLVPGPWPVLPGRFLAGRGVLATAISVPA
ncbi:hypothetical protein AB0J84_29195 [Micromonospora arborensis]|uniref:hypothetical protein n=1 Tax=Micromonospora arborensis TaxID=2116518 RepID=UPI00343286A2